MQALFVTCPTCGEASRNPAARGPMLEKDDPPELFWHGKRIGMPRTKIRIIAKLLRFGRVAEIGLLMLIGLDSDAKTLTVHISQIRKAFERQGVDAQIKSICGWGYEMKV